MRKTLTLGVLALGLGLFAPLATAHAGSNDYIVTGVSEDDMLKMRLGPGVGFRTILGLPNGTEVRVISCEQSGGKRWCKVSLKMARNVRGYVSFAYLRKI